MCGFTLEYFFFALDGLSAFELIQWKQAMLSNDDGSWLVARGSWLVGTKKKNFEFKIDSFRVSYNSSPLIRIIVIKWEANGFRFLSIVSSWVVNRNSEYFSFSHASTAVDYATKDNVSAKPAISHHVVSTHMSFASVAKALHVHSCSSKICFYKNYKICNFVYQTHTYTCDLKWQ